MAKHWEFLKASATLGRLSHAYLFSGNDRTEKQKTALPFVQYLNCVAQQKSKKPCGKCPPCVALERGIFPDCQVLRKPSISQIRALSSFLSLAPSVSLYKAVIIQEADAMQEEAQNAFLKLLEEPKGNVLFLLLAEHPVFLLPTIRSRVQELKFISLRPLLTKKEKQWIQEFQKLEKSDLAEKFAYAKKMSEIVEHEQDILAAWTVYLRERLVLQLRENTDSLAGTRRLLSLLQEIAFLFRTTNVNMRLAMERFFLYL